MKFIAKYRWWAKETMGIAERMNDLVRTGATKKDIDTARYEQLGLSCMRFAKVLEEEDQCD